MRSARAARSLLSLEDEEVLAPGELPDAPIVLPESELELELLLDGLVAAEVEPDVLPPDAPIVEEELPVLPLLMAAPVPSFLAGVPVAPMGVSWVLRWPAPMAGSAACGFGGVLWAAAVPTKATVATAASRAVKVGEEVIRGLLGSV